MHLFLSERFIRNNWDSVKIGMDHEPEITCNEFVSLCKEGAGRIGGCVVVLTNKLGEKSEA